MKIVWAALLSHLHTIAASGLQLKVSSQREVQDFQCKALHAVTKQTLGNLGQTDSAQKQGLPQAVFEEFEMEEDSADWSSHLRL